MKKKILFLLALAGMMSTSAMAQKKCNNCEGSGLEYRSCAFCGGEGIRECDFCLGKKMVRCNDCGGTGKVFCVHCNGRGGVNTKNGWRDCNWCDGQGTPACERCKETGQIVCWKCSGVGHYECNQCHGDKVLQWQCHVCGGTGLSKDQDEEITSTFKDDKGYSGTVKVQIDPNDSEQEKMRKIARARLAHRAQQMRAKGITVK